MAAPRHFGMFTRHKMGEMYQDGVSIAEIAEHFGCTEGLVFDYTLNVRTRLSREAALKAAESK